LSEAPDHELSNAGSDPSGGAGIQADLKTFCAFGVYGMAVITSLTAQNTRGVTAIHDPPAEFVAEQLRAVFADIRVDGIKTGMLKTEAVIGAVAGVLDERRSAPLVVDPVMVATSGDRLIEDAAVFALKRLLFPLATIVTPNREEAEVLFNRPVRDLVAAREAVRSIADLGPRAVLLKGVREGSEFVDLLFDEEGAREFRHPALPVGATHGTGCTLSSALAAGLAEGLPLDAAVGRATDYVWRAIRSARPVGGGGLPLNHLERPR
jgi:hydroxymethylpyrimidine/phosphomethylpyrimidine kinase